MQPIRFFAFISILIPGLIPLLGVVFWGWSVYVLVFLFWMESVVSGIFNIIKMILAKKTEGKTGMIFFFIIHYGVFITAYGFCVLFMVIPKEAWRDVFSLHIREIFTLMLFGYTAHFISDYVLTKKYKETTPYLLFFAPYSRVFILALIIFGGKFFLEKLHISHVNFYLIILCGVKLLADVFWYKMHQKMDPVSENKKHIYHW